MQITFDPAKDKLNRRKHGISLAEAARFDWSSAVIWPDMRRDYREPRMIGLGMIAHRLHAMVFVERNGVLRIISLRKANIREDKRYARQT